YTAYSPGHDHDIRLMVYFARNLVFIHVNFTDCFVFLDFWSAFFGSFTMSSNLKTGTFFVVVFFDFFTHKSCYITCCEFVLIVSKYSVLEYWIFGSHLEWTC
ncbi:hypothetical protein ACJX0J_023649, partial [Zea mays]